MKSPNLMKASVIVAAGALALTSCGDPEKTSDAESRDCVADFPKQELELIVPFSAGGSMDTAARQVAEVWPDHIGVPVTVTNMGGSGGQQAFSHIYQDDRNGHRVLASVEPYLSTALLRDAGEYEYDDFSFINIHEFDPSTIVVAADSPYETLQELVDASREQPGELSYATLSGGTHQVMMRMLAEQLDVEWREVTYPGGDEVRNSAISGETDFGAGTTSSGEVATRDDLRVLGMATENPMGQLADLPTINDALADENVEIPNLGSTRFFATTGSFQEGCPEQFDLLVETYEATLNDERYLELLGEQADLVTYYGPEESEEIRAEEHEVNQNYADILLGEE